jgi:VanZ family protein
VTGRPSGRPGAAGRSRRWWPPALWAAALFTVTSVPIRNPPDVGQGDKGVHLLLYGVLAWLLARAEPSLVRRAVRLLATLVALSALAAADEWHQQFIPGRSASVSDWVADTTGATLALLLAAVRRRQPA